MSRRAHRFDHPLIVAFSAIWLTLYAIGPALLHDALGCDHDRSTDTVEHHETNAAHWAASESDSSASGECPVCVSSKSFAVVSDSAVFVLDTAHESVSPTFAFDDLASPVRYCLIPRAPPV